MQVPKFDRPAEELPPDNKNKSCQADKSKKPSFKNQSERFSTHSNMAKNVGLTLTEGESNLYYVIWDFVKNGEASISYTELGRLTNKSPITIKQRMKVLMKRKIIIRITKGSNITHTASVYRMGRPDEIKF